MSSRGFYAGERQIINKYTINEKTVESSEGNNQGAAMKVTVKEGISREMLSGLFASKVVAVPMWGKGCGVGQKIKSKTS